MPLFSRKPKKIEMDYKSTEKPSLAIAYGMKRRSPKKMAEGGMVSKEYGSGPEMDMEPKMGMPKAKYPAVAKEDYDAEDWAGGSIADSSSTSMGPSEDEYDSDDWAGGGSVTDAVMRRRKARMMAEGGQVDLEANSEESPNMEDQYSFDADKKEQYDLDQADYSKDDNQIGDDDLPMDENDMVSMIRSKIRAKRGM